MEYPVLSSPRNLEMSLSAAARVAGSPAEAFGAWALTWQQIEARMQGEAAAGFRAFVREGVPMSKELANQVAEVVMLWARNHGVTHYTHWFQPLTGIAAEKHDAFMSLKYGPDGTQAIDRLPGALLLQAEPDASSFPSGGLRATHTARGYTVWDPTTPMFIRRDGLTPTLAVPCAYVSYTGHALDHKTPLLRALTALSKEGTRFLNLLTGTDKVKQVDATLGTEQEYFLIDREHLAQRPDLVMAGRTLLGRVPERNQQLEDHYFGPIPARVLAFMGELEHELYSLGVPVKTRHCEVAPGQFELAPIFEEVGVAVDHNLLAMDVMRRVAERHGLACLLHEKPFAGINGSGKHNNWSMSTDAGENLLDPGDTAEERARFAAVLAAVLTAVHQHAALMRVTVASAGNDHRLGANEAPPPIISAYLGDAIDALADAIERGDGYDLRIGKAISITKQLQVKLDATDRNRTAPFAFTGNKFEFRAVGSSENCAWPMTVLNAAVADAFKTLSDRIEAGLKAGGDRAKVVADVVREAVKAARPVRFEGNGYTEEWVAEAKQRGLPVLQHTPAALSALRDTAGTQFLLAHGVFDQEELDARHEILAERYLKALDIEAGTLADIALTRVLPALEAQASNSGDALLAFKQSGAPSTARQEARLHAVADLAELLQVAAEALEASREELFAGHDVAKGMQHAVDVLVPALAALRTHCDAAEAVVADALWPMPKYRAMLFPVG
ncbi:MAG: glutamine synthetase type [Cyanobacteria bacterium RYN_339]|nr:glutamine synthetase type [Cyanobacteria bacterium RYN_339]